MADKKYSVFVSSTYKDLRQARQRVMFALLEMNCIPAGMELFPAANESQWKVIQRVIDECDYYILILGGRYGSIAPNSDGMSYTEMEYRYALKQGEIQILRFPHEDPKSLLVGEEERKGEDGKWARLEEFRTFVQDRGTAKHWKTLDELYGKVSSTLAPLLAKSDRPGWVRGGSLPHASDLSVSPRKFNPGDMVILQVGGSGPMNVEGYEEDKVACVWQDKQGATCRDKYAESVLRIYTPPKIKDMFPSNSGNDGWNF